MCGIAGIVSLNSAPVRDGRDRVVRMVSLMRHRGPDAEGVWQSRDGGAVLGNTRLAIVGVADHFAVPMTTADGHCALSLNGEIYDHQTHRGRLQGQGVSFHTGSDTEVLLEGLRAEGDDFLDRVDGFWGFAFYHEGNKRLLLSRDLLGERHVFYHLSDNELIFASEINPVLAVMNDRPALDFESVVGAFRYRSPASGRTLVEGIERLRAGHNLVVENGCVDIRRYKRLQPERWQDFFASRPDIGQVQEAFDEQLFTACQSRVPDEVGFMATLSGGLDSTLVNVYASRKRPDAIESLYGVSTPEPPQRGDDLDEYQASVLTSKKLGTRHHSFDMMDVDVSSIYRQQCANSFDGLFCEGTIGFRQLAGEVARRGHKVLLLSDGPDELLGGYPVDREAGRLAEEMSGFPEFAGKLRDFARTAKGSEFLIGRQCAPFVNWSYTDDDPFAFRPIHGGTQPAILHRLFEDGVIADTDRDYGTVSDCYQPLLKNMDFGQKTALAYADSSLPDYFNVRSDRGANWHSVEFRLPMQAPALVELMIAAPSAYRYGDGESTKYLLRTLVEQYVSADVAWRGKYGFYAPAWWQQELEKRMGIFEVVGDSDVFEQLPFRPGIREFLLQPDQGRTRWMGYCLALTYEKLKGGDFSIEAVPA